MIQNWAGDETVKENSTKVAPQSAATRTDLKSSITNGGAAAPAGGCESGIQCVAVSGKRDNTSAWRLGVEWLTGQGPRTHTFKDGDPFAEELRKHRHIQALIKGVKEGSLPAKGKYPYSVAGWKGVPLYLHDYSNLLTAGNTGNLSVTFLGSYGLSYELEEDVLTMTITNNSTIESATHPPVIGYTKWWGENIGKKLNTTFSEGPLSKVSQKIILHENIGGK
jgi:hypothetical protein